MVALRRDTQDSYTDGLERYPIVEGIPYLRVGRQQLCLEVLRALELGDRCRALVLLLQDQDDWARACPPSETSLVAMLGDKISLRDAMDVLNFGPVADYFAYRWSDPTFLSGLALLQAHLPVGARVLELACGIGHYLREFERLGVPAVGADVVFAKLWLARRYMTPRTPLVCFDAGAPFPFEDECVQAVFCHDAFYFFPKKAHVASEMRRVAGREGPLLVGHAHNAAARNLSSGEPLTQAAYAELLPGCLVYDDAELTRSWVESRPPRAGAGGDVAALAFGTGSGGIDFGTPPVNGSLRLNPLFAPGALAPSWPSGRYREEYAGLSEYLNLTEIPTAPSPELVRRRVFVSLPEEW